MVETGANARPHSLAPHFAYDIGSETCSWTMSHLPSVLFKNRGPAERRAISRLPSFFIMSALTVEATAGGIPDGVNLGVIIDGERC